MTCAMRDNLTGGQSIVFHRCQLKGKTLIRDNEGNIVQTVTGYDANALYLWCTGLEMPMGKPRVYHYNVVSNQIELSFDPGVSEKQNTWLAGLCNNGYPELRYAIKMESNELVCVH